MSSFFFSIKYDDEGKFKDWSIDSGNGGTHESFFGTVLLITMALNQENWDKSLQLWNENHSADYSHIAV